MIPISRSRHIQNIKETRKADIVHAVPVKVMPHTITHREWGQNHVHATLEVSNHHFITTRPLIATITSTAGVDKDVLMCSV